MTRPENRSQLMDRVGAVQLNTMWSWCGVNEQKQQVYFSIWTHMLVKDAAPKTYIIQDPDWGVSAQGEKSAARNDHDAKFALVFEQGYAPYG